MLLTDTTVLEINLCAATPQARDYLLAAWLADPDLVRAVRAQFEPYVLGLWIEVGRRIFEQQERDCSRDGPCMWHHRAVLQLDEGFITRGVEYDAWTAHDVFG